MMMGVLLWVMVLLIASKIAYKVIVRRASKGGGGRQKVILLLPLLPLFIYVPWLPSSCHIRTIFAMVLLWTAPSKLLLLCFNTPIDPFPSSFSHFLVAIFLPIHISSLSTSKGDSLFTSSNYASTLVKLLLLVGILNIYPIFPFIPSPLLYFLYCCHFYLGLQLCLGGIAWIMESGFGMRLYAQFNEPLKSTSLAEFWGRRWNLTINSILKETIYKPLLKSSLQRRLGTDASKALAMLASFATSGLFHEIIFVYVSKSAATGEMTAFFVLHGLATVAEVAIGKRCPSLRGMPTWTCRALTLSFLYVTVSFFFLRPLRRSKTDVRAIGEYHYLQSTLVGLFR